MNVNAALTFIRKHGVVLMSARGPVPTLTYAIVGERIRGSWWAHPQSHHIWRLLGKVCESRQVLVCRLVGGKVTLAHRRLWPALVRLAGQLPKRGLAAIREEHTARGSHRVIVTPFPRWVPKPVLNQGRRLSEVVAVRQVGPELLQQVSRQKFAQPKSKRMIK